MSKRDFEVEMSIIPKCQLCKEPTEAKYDARTKHGPWAYLCELHFQELGVGLGLGRGQKLVHRPLKLEPTALEQLEKLQSMFTLGAVVSDKEKRHHFPDGAVVPLGAHQDYSSQRFPEEARRRAARTQRQGNVTIETVRGGFTESYDLIVTGPKADVNEWLKSYFAQYPSAGYGTCAFLKEDGEEVRYRVWRSYTCD